jgi:uncharacterized membrane protein YeaQ/YmgE (transglycosylase-associated protein family)
VVIDPGRNQEYPYRTAGRFLSRARHFPVARSVRNAYKETNGGKMTLTGFLILLVIAGIVGALGQGLAGYSFGGCLGSILLGFIGAFVGVWLARQLGLPEFFTVTIDGEPFPVVWATIGAAILALLFGLIGRRRYV